MSTEEIEKHIRDHDESIRNLERIGGETVSAIRSLHERMSKSQEYQLRDNRLSAEEMKDTFREYANRQEIKCGQCSEKIEKAITDISWLDRWVLALSSAFCAFFGWDFYSGIKK